jgi:hypothetical protein
VTLTISHPQPLNNARMCASVRSWPLLTVSICGGLDQSRVVVRTHIYERTERTDVRSYPHNMATRPHAPNSAIVVAPQHRGTSPESPFSPLPPHRHLLHLSLRWQRFVRRMARPYPTPTTVHRCSLRG